ncbi:NAD(P)H-binding protein [Phascolarctobacterium sp.]|uniref:NAD(P)H-binding protein n=1 Tax=Phascolarctobacterium sp. TaxID=2049039 RepID=UPI00386455BD
MEKFAFILHPLTLEDMQHLSPIMKYIPDSIIEACLKMKKPFKVSHITGVKSPYAEAEGWFIGCPLTAKQMVELPEEFVMDRIIESGKVAQELGAKIVGLGAFTSIVGDAGITVAKNLDIAVTSGNSYTVATAIQGTKEAARMMGKSLQDCRAVVVGATGSIGAASVRLLAKEVKHITLVARHRGPLEELAQELIKNNSCEVEVSQDIHASLKEADIVITVTSALDFLIEPKDLRPGTVVCDVARPRNVSREVSLQRNDVLVIEGGIINVPGNVDFHFNFGFPPKTSYACMSETMILALDGRYENFSLGRNLDINKVNLISQLADKHHFKMSGFRNFERAVSSEHIEEVRHNAQLALAIHGF